MKDIKIIDEIISRIKKAKNIAVIGHLEPDGDCVGSQMAISLSLKSIGYSVDLVNEGPYETRYIGDYKNFYLKDIEKNYDLYIIVDTPIKERIGRFSGKIDYSKALIIDHHVTNVFYGSINWIDDNFISTSEMVFLLLFRMKIGLDNKEVCQHLLNGIISDNGFFRHVRNDKSFSLISTYFLIEKNANPKESYDLIFGRKSFSSKKLLGAALGRIERSNEGKLIWTYITEEDKKMFNNSMIESTNVFNEIMSIEGAEVGIFFKEGKDFIDISFRSLDNYDVSQLALNFNGGGHKAASGAKVAGELKDVMNKVLEKASLLFQKN